MHRTLTLLALACGLFACGGEATDETMPAATDIEEALSELSPDDRAAAEAQKTCPVSGEPLGSMGAPIQVTAGDGSAWLCCEGCRKRFERDPAKYLAKLSR